MASICCRLGRIFPRFSGHITIPGVRLSSSHLVRRMDQHYFANIYQTTSRNVQTSQITKEVDSSNEQDLPIDQELDRRLYKMDLEMRKVGRVGPHEFDQVMNLVRSSKFASATHAQMMLRSCGNVSTDESKEMRRKRLDDLVPLLHSVLKLDVSHFNAILKASLENGAKVDISSFLGEMESNGVSPNRVTYQHLIGLYCMEGNIAGATTVLEQMKQEDLAINESVFHSLLYGHTINEDIPSVNATLDIMKSVGLPVRAEAYTWLLVGAARARDWNRVEGLLKETQDKEISLDCTDYFRLLVALCESGMVEHAKSILSQIPKRSGYFTEMRRSLPQIMFTGELEFAYQVLDEHQTQAFDGLKDEDELKYTKGVFFSRVMSRNELEPHKCAQLVVRLFKDGYTEQLKVYILNLLTYEKEHHLQALKEELAKEGVHDLKFEGQFDCVGYMRNIADRLGFEKVDTVIRHLKDFGFRLRFSDIARKFIHMKIDLDSCLPGKTFVELSNTVREIHSIIWYNTMIRYLMTGKLLKQEKACSGFLLNMSHQRPNPLHWIKLMAESAMHTRSTETIINTLFIVRMNCEVETIEDAYTILPFLSGFNEEEDMLGPVLEDIHHNKLGVPRRIADLLETKLQDERLKEILNDCVLDFENVDLWTDENQQKFLEQRKKLLYNSFFREDYYDEDIKKVPRRRREETRLVSNLMLNFSKIKNLAEDNMPEKAVPIIESTLKEYPTFIMNPSTFNSVIQSFLRTNDLEAGLKFFYEYYESDCLQGFFSSTYCSLIQAYAEQDDHEKVMDMLVNFPKDGKFLRKSHDVREFREILKLYEAHDDLEKTEEVVEAIAKIFNRNIYGLPYLMRFMVLSKIKRDDTEGAITAFQNYARKGKFLAAPDAMITCVVQDNNPDNLKRVMDSCEILRDSSEVIYSIAKVYLEVGKRQEAKNMLETPGLRYYNRCVSVIMQKFTENERLDCLEDFVLLSKNIRGCDRDHMYLTWLNAVNNNASMAQEIWLEIQEEGHFPSKELRTKLAQVLKSCNTQIPFDVEDIKDDTIDKSKLETPSNKHEYATLQEQEIDALVKSLKDYVTIPELKNGFQKLCNNGRFDKVAEVFNAVGYMQHRKLTRKYCDMLLSRISHNLDNKQMKQFLDDMSYDTANYLRRKSHYKKLQIKEMDTEAFLSYIKSKALGIDRGEYCLSPMSVEQLIKKDDQFLEKLEEVSNEGCGAATVVLARHACHQQNSQQFVRYWNMDTRDNREVAREMILDPNSLESLKWISETVDYDPDVLEITTNKCFKQDGREKEILQFALTNGLSLDVINTNTLRKVSSLNLPEFDQNEIKRILMYREVESGRPTPY